LKVGVFDGGLYGELVQLQVVDLVGIAGNAFFFAAPFTLARVTAAIFLTAICFGLSECVQAGVGFLQEKEGSAGLPFAETVESMQAQTRLPEQNREDQR
jgi:hypothetical protein